MGPTSACLSNLNICSRKWENISGQWRTQVQLRMRSLNETGQHHAHCLFGRNLWNAVPSSRNVLYFDAVQIKYLLEEKRLFFLFGNSSSIGTLQRFIGSGRWAGGKGVEKGFSTIPTARQHKGREALGKNPFPTCVQRLVICCTALGCHIETRTWERDFPDQPVQSMNISFI